MQRTLERELKVPETAVGEAVGWAVRGRGSPGCLPISGPVEQSTGCRLFWCWGRQPGYSAAESNTDWAATDNACLRKHPCGGADCGAWISRARPRNPESSGTSRGLGGPGGFL